MEFHKILVNDDDKSVYIDLTAQNDIMEFIENKEENNKKEEEFIMQYEFGKWMIEGKFIFYLKFSNL